METNTSTVHFICFGVYMHSTFKKNTYEIFLREIVIIIIESGHPPPPQIGRDEGTILA